MPVASTRSHGTLSPLPRSGRGLTRPVTRCQPPIHLLHHRATNPGHPVTHPHPSPLPLRGRGDSVVPCLRLTHPSLGTRCVGYTRTARHSSSQHGAADEVPANGHPATSGSRRRGRPTGSTTGIANLPGQMVEFGGKATGWNVTSKSRDNLGIVSDSGSSAADGSVSHAWLVPPVSDALLLARSERGGIP